MKALLFLVTLAMTAPAFANICKPETRANRAIEWGDRVIYQNKYVRVFGEACKDGLYDVQSTDGRGTMTYDVPRDELSVLRSCQNGLCVSEIVIDLSTSSEVRIVALSTNGRYIISPVNGRTLSGPIDRQQLAKLQ